MTMNQIKSAVNEGIIPSSIVSSLLASSNNSFSFHHKFGRIASICLLALLMATICHAESDVPEDTRRWNNGVGLWGKRSDSDMLDGMMQRGARLVEKRPEDSWHRLNSLWGKRAAPSASNWQTATGLWGKKRSSPPFPPAWTQLRAVVADYDFLAPRN